MSDVTTVTMWEKLTGGNYPRRRKSVVFQVLKHHWIEETTALSPVSGSPIDPSIGFVRPLFITTELVSVDQFIHF